MLSIMDPVELEQLVLYRDDEDPRKFYLLPDEPVIPTDEAGVPDFLFIKYIRDVDVVEDGQQSGAGYIQFRSVLTISRARRDRVIKGLRAILEQDKQSGRTPFGVQITSTEPLLAAPLWTSGKVRLETFKVGDNELVRKATAEVPVDLAGALGASFNLQLDAEGADIFWASFERFQEQQVPILITYELTYKARVSARMEIHAERSTVEKQIWERANPRPYRFAPKLARWIPMKFIGALTRPDLVKLRAQTRDRVAACVEPAKIKEAIRSSITDGTITVNIHTDTAGAGGDGAASGADASGVQDTLFKVATEILSDRVIPALFGDASPQPATKSEEDTAIEKQVLELKIDSTDTASTTFDIDLTSTSTIERGCNPNGPIQVLLPDPAVLTACFKELRLADGFFRLMRVTASTAGINFERDGIDMVHVFLRYRQIDEANPLRPEIVRSSDGVLRSETDTVRWKFDMARSADGAHKSAYEFRTDVYYGDIIIKTDWAPANEAMLLINPAAMGAVRVELTLTAPKEHVKSARVLLRYERSSGEILTDDVELTPEAGKKTWFKATGEIARGAGARTQPYEYQVTYRVANGEIALPWTRSSDETLEIPGPFTKVSTYNLRAQGSFEGVSSIAGDVVYEDAAHGYRVVKSFLLDKAGASFAFEVPVLAGAPDEVTWTARINRADGSMTQLPPGRGPAGTLWIGEAVADFLTIQVVPDLIDFDSDVQLCVVAIHYRDDSGHVEDRAMKFSKAAKGEQTVRIALREGAPRRYSADIRYIAYDRAKSSEEHLKDVEDTLLLLERKAP